MRTLKRAAAVALTLGGAAFSTAAYPATFVVNSTLDAIDSVPGDGLCATDTDVCTLRAAVMEANATAGADSIDLTGINDPNSPITLTIEGVDETFVEATGGATPCDLVLEANAAVGDLDITEDVDIFGAGPALTVIRWENQSLEDPDIGDRIFHIQAVGSTTVNLVRIADLMVTGGSVGIPNSLDASNPYNCGDVAGEPGSQSVWQFRRFGGGIAVGAGATLALFQESVHGPGTGGGGGEGPPPDVGPGGDEGETGGVTAVDFERIAVIGNQSGSDAGGVIAAAEMTMVDSVLSGNLSNGNGGGLYIDSPTSISGTLIGTSSSDMPYASGALSAALLGEPNQGENGGGIFDTGSHTTNIEASAINGNTAIGGGGIGARALVVINLTNTTVSGNTGSDVGGGITTNGTVNLRNVTVANNLSATDAPGGGAGLNSFGSGTYTLVNTILSNNLVQGAEAAREANCGCSGGSANCPPGTIVSTGYNVNDETVDTCLLDIALNDQLATDPLLEPLANNGGLTETHALPTEAIGDASTSPAIDSGDTARCPNNDQRGSLRPDDGDLNGTYLCDVGAYERFIARTDLHINNVTVPNQVNKGDSFTAVVEIHNEDGNVTAPGVTLDAMLNTLTGMSIDAASSTAGTCTVTPPDAVSCAIGDMAVGAIETVTLSLTGNEQGTFSLESTVAQTGNPDIIDPVAGNNTVVSNVFVLGVSDIALTGGPAAASVDQGDTITLDYSLVNNGADDATEVRMGLVIPTGTSFVSATSSVGACVESSGEVRCNIGDLAAADPAVAIAIELGTDASGDVAIEASAAADQTDPDLTNNTAASTVTVIANADLALTAATVDTVRTKKTFTVTVTVSNNGPQDATNVVATANLPTLVSFVSSSACTLSGATVTCTAAQIGAGSSTAFAVELMAETAGTATVNASVTADENDPDLSNNSGSVSVTIKKKNSGGGCAYLPGGAVDPTLPALLVFSLLALWWRRRAA
ncbi:MAG: choice-of-anchor Q domain-containing protein [Pseudomonadales bacterium]